MNKQGQTPQDVFLFIIVVLVFAIGGVVASLMMDSIVGVTNNMTAFNSSTAIMDSIKMGQTVNTYWDYIILSVMIGFALAIIVLGYFIDVHPLFSIFYVIGLAIGTIIAYVLQYVWEYFSAVSQFTSIITTNFTITNHILSNAPVYFLIVGVIGLVANYAKPRRI